HPAMDHNTVFASRIKQAQTIGKLSMDDLVAKLLRNGVKLSKQAISKYENGESVPSSRNLLALSNALEQPVEFFFREPKLSFERLEFRKVKTRLIKKEEDSIIEGAQDYFERYMEIEELLGEGTYN